MKDLKGSWKPSNGRKGEENETDHLGKHCKPVAEAMRMRGGGGQGDDGHTVVLWHSFSFNASRDFVGQWYLSREIPKFLKDDWMMITPAGMAWLAMATALCWAIGRAPAISDWSRCSRTCWQWSHGLWILVHEHDEVVSTIVEIVKWSHRSRRETCVSNNRGRCSNGSRGLSAHSTLEGAKNENWTILYWRDRQKRRRYFCKKRNNRVWTHLKHRQHIQQLPVQVLRTMILIVKIFYWWF